MNFKKILVLVMTFAMLLSTFAPTLGVFAEELHNHVEDNNNDKDTLDYVSLGDSMTNGIGMPGYDSTGSNGYLEIAPDSYPAQFAEWLKTFTGKEVNLTQLATSAARVEDVYYMISRGAGNVFEPEYWTFRELLTNRDRWGDHNGPWHEMNEAHDKRNGEVANVFYNSVKNADIVSLATGNGNFGVFLMGRIMNLVGFGSEQDLKDDQENYAYMTIENALKLCEANEEVTKLVLDAYASAVEYLTEMNLPMEFIETIANYTAYTTASYVVHTMKTIDLIVEMNPDVTLMIVPLINNGLNFNFQLTLHGITKTFDAGDYLGALYTPLNAFLAAYPTVKQEAGEFEDAKFLYAELPELDGEVVQVETFAQAFNTLYAPVEVLENGTVVYPESRRFCHSRFYPEIQSFVMPIIFGGSEADYYGAFDLNDIIAYETAQAQGTAAFAVYAAENAGKVQLLAYYLGIVDAVLSSMKAVANVNLDEISVPAGETFSMFSILGPVVGGLQSEIPAKVAENAEAIAPRLAYELIAANITPVLEPYFSNPEFLYVFGADLEIYGDDSVEKTLAMIELAMTNDARFDLNGDLKEMKAALVGGYNQIANGLELLSMAVVLPETLSEALTSVGLLEALLALYGRLKLAWGLSAHPSYNGHDTLTESLVNAYENDYTAKEETIENIKEAIILAIEVTDKAYQGAYDYVDEAGYIDNAVSIIDSIINNLENADLSGVEMTEEFRVLLDKEIEATIATLKEIKDVLANDSAKDVEGLVKVILALEDDLYAHLTNIYALCAQAGIDVNQLVILPALKEALVLIETELIPALKELAKEFVDAVIAHVMEKAEELYNSALGLSKEVYLQLVGLLVTVKLHVEEKVDAIVDAIVDQYLTVVEKVYTTLGNIDTAIATANKVVEYVIGRLVNVGTDVKDIAVLLNDIVTIVYEILVDAGVPVDEAIELAVEVATEALEMYLEELGIKDACDAAKLLLEKAYELLVESGLTVEEALELAAKAFAGAVVTIVKHFDDIDNALDVTKEVLQTVYDFLVANRVEITVALKTAIEVTKTVAETVIAVVETVEDAIEYATNVFEYVLEVAGNVYETAEEIYATATELYAQLLNTIAKIHNAIETTIEIYNYVYNLLVEVFGNIENAVRVATKICQLVVEFVQNNPELLENAYKLGVEIYNLIVEVYGETDDINATANAVYAYVLRLLAAAEVELKDAIYHASNGNYLITEESFYLALGNSYYTEELAEMLFLGDKYTQYYELTEDYREDLAKADLVTVKMENGELFSFAYDQILGTVAGIVRNSESFADYESIIAPALEEYGLNIYSEPLTLEWSKYMDEETLAIFRGALDSLTAQLVAAGVPEVYELDLTPVVMEQLPEGIAIKPIVMEIPLAELVVYAIENVLYAYAETTERIVNTLETIYEVAPNATVVITAISNPFELIGLLLEDYVPDASEYVAVADEVVELFNLPLYLAALTHKNTIYVENEDAAEIYEALHARCAHAYDDCVDTECNICGETRVAPGHVWGEWVTVVEPTTEKEGSAERTCSVCGCKETKSLDKLPTTPVDPDPVVPKPEPQPEPQPQPENPGLGTGAIIAIVVASVVVACGAGAAAYWFFFKKKQA